jgi:menaquinone-dependent protoporphyrinogen oxidase
MIPRILVAYSSKHGQAEAVARRIADSAPRFAIEPGMVDVRYATAAELHASDAVVIVASVYFGRFAKPVRRFVSANRRFLSSAYSAFVSVSGAAAEVATLPEAQRTMSAFLEESGWNPVRTRLVAGALRFTRYNPLVRFIVKRAAASGGRTVDTTVDHEFTDWNDVTAFAEEFLAGVHVAAARIA